MSWLDSRGGGCGVLDAGIVFRCYLAGVRVTWDPAQARANLAKHRVSFEEPASVFMDPFALEAPDLVDPDRTIVLGRSARECVPFVVTILWEEARVARIISARRATPQQRKKYEEAP